MFLMLSKFKHLSRITQEEQSVEERGEQVQKEILRIAEATFNEYKDEWILESTQQNPAGQHGFNTMNQGGKACHKYGSTQHLKRDCPQSGNSNRGGNNNDNGGNNHRSN